MRVVGLALLGLALFAGSLVAADPTRAGPSPMTLSLRENHAFHIVDYLTWCGDCVNGEDVTSQEPYTFQPGTYWPFDLSLPPTNNSQPGCRWDSDDYWFFGTSGNILDAGATASAQACWYSSHYSSPYLLTYFVFRSASPDLLIREHFEWAGGSHVSPYLVPIRDGSVWRYQQCWFGPQTPLGPVVEIPDSHGCMALPVRVTLTVTNPTTRKVGKTGGIWGADPRDQSLYCTYPIPFMP